MKWTPTPSFFSRERSSTGSNDCFVVVVVVGGKFSLAKKMMGAGFI
jgi:hypothetical protein